MQQQQQQQQQTENDDIYSTQIRTCWYLGLGALPTNQPTNPTRRFWRRWYYGTGMPDEVLEGIFTARRQRSNNAEISSWTPIPMNERQWSIPSIHMAQPLQGSDSSAATSYTEHTKDDETRLFGRGDDYDYDYDDASLSSHCSSLYLPDSEMTTAGGEPLHLDSNLSTSLHQSPFPRQSFQPRVVMNPQVAMDEYTAQKDLSKVNDADDDADDDDADLSRNAVYDYVDRRKRKQRKREELAFDWLLSVQANKHVLAEAASSKFLTGNGNRRRRPAVAVAAKGVRPELAAASKSAANAGALEQPRIPVPVVALRKTATPAMLQQQALASVDTYSSY
jgi:hypothetical protein